MRGCYFLLLESLTNIIFLKEQVALLKEWWSLDGEMFLLYL